MSLSESTFPDSFPMAALLPMAVVANADCAPLEGGEDLALRGVVLAVARLEMCDLHGFGLRRA